MHRVVFFFLLLFLLVFLLDVFRCWNRVEKRGGFGRARQENTPCVRVNGMFEELIRGALTISLGGAVITSCRSFQELKSFLKM